MRYIRRVSAIYIMQQYILQKYTKFRLIHFGSVSNCRYRSIQAQVSFFQHSTIAALYKRPRGCAEGARPCAPFCGFLTFQCDLILCGLPQSMWHTAGSRCGLYDRSSAIHAAYTASSAIHAGIRDLRSPCGYYFPHTKFRKYLINKVFPSDSPRIRPRLSYASVRSME